MVLNTIRNNIQHKRLDEAVTLLNAHPIYQATDDHVPGRKYSMTDLSGT
jgi:hypothetical protein